MNSGSARDFVVSALLVSVVGHSVICPARDQEGNKPPSVAVTVTSRVSVWSSPGTLSQRVTILEPGTAIVVTGYRQKYFQIKYKSKTGYVDARDLPNTAALARLVEQSSEPSDRQSGVNSDKTSNGGRADDNAAKLKLLTLLYGEKAATRMMQKKVWKGMTKTMVIQSLGEPKSVKKTVYENVTKEQWEYEDGTLLFFDNDILMAYGGPPRDFSMPDGSPNLFSNHSPLDRV